jgi:Camelysin metallo-endopeptidase
MHQEPPERLRGRTRRFRRVPIVAFAAGSSQWVRGRHGVLAAVWLAVLTLSIGAGTLSLATFTDQAPVDGAFSTGTITLGLQPATTLVTFAGMVPGDQVEAPLIIADDGTGALRYAMTSVASDVDGKHARDVLQLTVERRTGCAGAVLETVYDGPIATAVFGDPQVGADLGDRALNGGTSEKLCFRVTLPVDTDVLYQTAATTVTFSFSAEQTANNP